MLQEKYSMPEGCIYYYIPEAQHNAATIISLRYEQAVLVRTRTEVPYCNYNYGDYPLSDFLRSKAGKILCEIEFISLKTYQHPWGRRIPIWNGSSIGINGSFSIRANEAKPEVFSALLRAFCIEQRQIPPEDFCEKISENAIHILETEIQDFAKQHSYGAEALIQHQVELVEEINKHLQKTIVDGVKLVSPLIVNGVIL